MLARQGLLYRRPISTLNAADTRPPIFFKEQDSFRRQLQRWGEGRLRLAMARAADAEFRIKQTGFPAETICREALFAIAREAREIQR